MRQDKTTPQVDEAVIAEALRTSIPTARCIVADLADAGFEIVPKPAGSAARVGEARRTGDWSAVSDADWKAWVNVLRQSNPATAAEFLPTYQDLAGLHGLYVRGDGTVTRLDRAAFDAGVVAIIERDRQPGEDAPGYLKAVRLLRGALPSIKEIDDALGGASPDGSQGNVWALRQRIVDRRPPAGPFWGEPDTAPAEPASEPKVKAGRVVVLDEAGERKLQDLLAGKSVPTGRLVEVTYRMPNGTTKTVRHAEFGKLDSVSYDPLPPVGSRIEGATVLGARATVKLQPGRRVGVGVHDREGAEGCEVLGVFWTDGVISFSGDFDQMREFKAQLARLAAMPATEGFL